MRELSTPSLFDVVTPVPPVMSAEPIQPEESRSEKLAKEFVRWCFSFGSAFRNSPDIINLRSWLQRTKLKLKESEETALLSEARRLFLKRIDQMMRKVDAPILKPETIVADAPPSS